MRYVITFSDRTTKRVSLEAAKIFMQAMRTGEPIFYKGNMYSGRFITSVRTIFGWLQDKRIEAEEQGHYFCRYGKNHNSRLDCACKDAGFEKLITVEEEKLMLEESEKQETKICADSNLISLPR